MRKLISSRFTEFGIRPGLRLWLLSLTTCSIPALLLLPLSFRPARAAEQPSLSTHVATRLIGNGTVGPYQLGAHFVLQGTEQVRKNGLLLEGERDYFMNYDYGTITFSFPLLPDDTLLVNYQKLNLTLRRRYFHRELVYQQGRQKSNPVSLPGAVSSAPSKEERWRFLPGSGESDLELTGSKTFSVEVGSAQDVSLKQGLWLSATGNATKNTEISVQLSDQNMPATAQGSTKRLEELDKVQLLVSSPHFSGTLGDFYVAPSGSDLFFYEKKLKGITAEAGAGESSASVTLASSKGEYFTNRFNGRENKQGPYQLQGKNGQTNIMVLPGTERVWIDGEEIGRGSDNDYTIDYSRGTIQFTPRRLITSDSRITVDFEYSTENYKRDFYSGSLLAGFLEGKAKLEATGIHEADDESRPSAFSLSAEDKAILRRAGNDRHSASREGATFAGEGMGDYEAALDSLGNPFYRYVGSDSGSYKVSFSRVGEGEGSYQYAGGGVYTYVYPGNGDFLPKTFLPLPESHSLFDLKFSFRPAEALNTQIEWAKSKNDGNTLSQKEDGQNWGDAVSLKSTYQNSDFQFLKPDFHRLELAAEYKLLKRDFAPFGRVDMVEKDRKWNLPDRSVSADEMTYGVNGLISPFQSFLMSFDYGKLEAENVFASRRGSVGLEVFPAGWISAEGRSERITSQEITEEAQEKEGRWTRNSVVVNNRLKSFSTSLSWEQERRTSSLSGSSEERRDFDQLSGAIRLGLSSLIKISTRLSYREDDEFREGYAARSSSYTWRSQLSVQQYRGMLSSDLEFARRIKKYRKPAGEDSKQDLFLGRVDFHPPSQLLTVRLYHSQNQINSGQRWDTYLEVEEGSGDYRYEDGEYVPHSEGNFIRISEWVGETRPSLELNKSVRIIFSPHKVVPREGTKSFWPKIGRVLSVDSFISLKGRFERNRPLGHYLLYPLTGLSGGSVLSRNSTIRHDLYLLPTWRALSLRFRWEKGEDDDNLASDGGRSEERLRRELLLKSHVSSRHYVETRAGMERIEGRRQGRAEDLISGKSLAAAFTRRQTRAFDLKLASEYRIRDQKTDGTSVEFLSLTPEILVSLLSRGRLSARFGWTHLRSRPEEKSLSYLLTEGKRRGENYEWRCFFDYKLNRHLTTSVTYRGESVPKRKADHTARMELKAFF